ncbi:MAG TPA: DUF5107 domain-containing protein [Polyangiaceae bacterium]|nr:DUF5107 domain-containing protein [Polyangiaceae bacterium]
MSTNRPGHESRSTDKFTFCGLTPALCALSLLASTACGGNDGETGNDSVANTTVTSGPVTTGSAGPNTTGAMESTASAGPVTTGSGTTSNGADTASTSAGDTSTAAAVTDGTGGTATASTGSDGNITSTTGGGNADRVTRTASTFTFQHFPIEANSEHVWIGPESPVEEPTSTTYDTVVLENAYLKVTLLPDYGGRILSIVHKPTGRELLYQNALGTPYLMYDEIFYYDYLVIMGGIFPSFPEPEHGKYWNQPYSLEVISETDDAVTVRMSRQDDLDLAAGVPAVYDTGRTDVLVELDVTLRAGSSRLELDTKLTNTRDSAVPEFEYWTVTTLAPGSPPGETSISLNARIIADMEQVHLLESSWPWFGEAETRVADEVFTWDNLSYFTNWVDQGTAFANPDYRANYAGTINYDNDIGILRVSDNVETPGLKLWTFGTGSLDIDINDSDEWLRPTIEMWYGITPEFWARTALAANEVRTWSDVHFPTLGLREITAASEYGAVYLSRSADGTTALLSAAATLTLPDQTVHAILRLDGSVVAEQDVVVAAAEATTLSATVPSADIAPGAVFEVEFLQGDTSLLSGQTTLE